jgi:hypothetical protein
VEINCRSLRFSSAYAISAFCGVGILALLLGTFVFFTHLPWCLLVLAFIAVTYRWNIQCISHNFIRESDGLGHQSATMA